MLVGGLSILPPYVGPPLGLELDVPASVEVVDHVLPGVVAMLCGGLTALRAHWDMETQANVPSLLLYSSAFLAGLFQTATHVPLVFEAGDRLTPWAAVLLHSTLAPVVTVIALWLTAMSLKAVFPDSIDSEVAPPQERQGR